MYPEHTASLSEDREFLADEELSTFDRELYPQSPKENPSKSPSEMVRQRYESIKAEVDIHGLGSIASRKGSDHSHR